MSRYMHVVARVVVRVILADCGRAQRACLVTAETWPEALSLVFLSVCGQAALGDRLSSLWFHATLLFKHAHLKGRFKHALLLCPLAFESFNKH